MGGWSDTDNKANLSPASLRYAANGAVAELGNTLYGRSYYFYVEGFRVILTFVDQFLTGQ